MNEWEEATATPLDDIDVKMNRLERLPISAPPMLTRACGYGGKQRYVVFLSEDEGGRDNLQYDDGVGSFRCAFTAWLIWRSHLCVYPHLVQYEFSAPEFSGRHGRHCLLVDRLTGCLYVARFLRNQVGDRLPAGTLVIEDVNGEMVVADPEDAAAMQKFNLALERRVRESMREMSGEQYQKRVERIQEQIAIEARQCDALREWLDGHVTEQARQVYDEVMRAEYERILGSLFDSGNRAGDPQ